jgi:hypothetical protein
MCLTAVLLATFATAAPALELKVSLEKGQEFKQVMTIDQTIEQTMMNQTQTVQQKHVLEATQRVESVDEAGVATVTYIYDAIAIEQTTPMGAMKYSSRAEGEQTHPGAAVYSAVVGSEVTMKIHPDGSVTGVTGTDALVEKVSATIDMPEGPMREQALAGIKEQFGPERIAETQQQFLDYVPGKPVAEGDTWTSETTSDTGMTLLITTEYTLESAGAGEAVLDASGTIATPEGGFTQQAGPLTMTGEMSGTQEGTLTVDTATGLVKHQEVTQKITGTLKPESDDPQAAGMTIPMDITTRMTLDLTETDETAE